MVLMLGDGREARLALGDALVALSEAVLIVDANVEVPDELLNAYVDAQAAIARMLFELYALRRDAWLTYRAASCT